jgi:hypothetical protein
MGMLMMLGLVAGAKCTPKGRAATRWGWVWELDRSGTQHRKISSKLLSPQWAVNKYSLLLLLLVLIPWNGTFEEGIPVAPMDQRFPWMSSEPQGYSGSLIPNRNSKYDSLHSWSTLSHVSSYVNLVFSLFSSTPKFLGACHLSKADDLSHPSTWLTAPPLLCCMCPLPEEWSHLPWGCLFLFLVLGLSLGLSLSV